MDRETLHALNTSLRRDPISQRDDVRLGSMSPKLPNGVPDSAVLRLDQNQVTLHGTEVRFAKVDP